MECKVTTPKITTYALRFNPEQEPDIYFRCMWARMTLDHDNFTLSIISDCGNYTYSWQPSEQESFLDLMCRVNSDYLLGKISNRNKFNLEESKRETIENIKNYEDQDVEEKIKAIEGIEDCEEEGFYLQAISIIESEEVEIVKDFHGGAKIICLIFEQYLRPLLRESREQNK